MKVWKLGLISVSFAAVLAACGGSDSPPPADNTPVAAPMPAQPGPVPVVPGPFKFTRMVSFGDSLSDVGTYRVGLVANVGGGKYTVNGPDAKNWTELVATQYGLPAPCAAQTGLDGSSTLGLSVPVTNFPNCTNYAQGGSRVTAPVGPGNKLLGGNNAVLGQLTVPVKTQLDNYLAGNANKFSETDLVTIQAGGNDLFMQAGGIPSRITELVTGGVTVEAATTQASTEAVQAMGVAGAELAGYVKNLIVDKGVRHVLVVNLPNVAKTPYALAQAPSTQALIDTMVTTYNSQLQSGLATVAGSIYVDAYTVSTDQAADPAKYGISNNTKPACDTASTNNPLGGSSLTCTAASVIAGDVSKYQYADDVHPTPFGYQLYANLVIEKLQAAGLK